MQYSLSTVALCAVAFGTSFVYASPLLKARNPTDEITTDAPLWFQDIQNITNFIQTAAKLNASTLHDQASAAVLTWSDQHAREVQLNNDLGKPGNGVPDTEFNGVWQSVNEAFQNMRDDGQKGKTANPKDIDTALAGLCGPAVSAANAILGAAGQITHVAYSVTPPTNCKAAPSSMTTAAPTSTSKAASSAASTAAAT